MKKIILSVLCLAAAAMTFTACSDVDDFVIENNINNTEHGLKLVAGMPGAIDDTRVEIGNENGKIVPMWSITYDINNSKLCPDFVFAIFEGQKRIYRFDITSPVPAKTATFQELIPEGMQSIAEDLKAVPADTKVYFMKNDGYENEDDFTKPTAWMLGNTIKQGQIPSTDDYLTSLPINAGDIVNNGASALNLSFKRMNGIIRINLIPEEGFDFNKEFVIVTVGLTTQAQNAADGDFGGRFNLDLAEGTMTAFRSFSAKTAVLNDRLYKGHVQTIKPGKDGFPAYVCSRPISLKAGQKIYLTLETSGRTDLDPIEYTVPEGGIDIKAGTITTFNLKITRKNMRSNNIDLIKKGTLTEQMMENAIAYAKEKGMEEIRINGEINGADIQVIKDVLSKPVSDEHPMIGLDMYGTVIKGGDGTYYTDQNGTKRYISNNTMGEYMFYNMPRLKTLRTPPSLEYINKGAIYMNENLEFLLINNTFSSITIQSGAISLMKRSEWAKHELYFNVDKYRMANPPEDMINGFDNNADLSLKSDWMNADGNGGYSLPNNIWQGIKWKKIDPLF